MHTVYHVVGMMQARVRVQKVGGLVFIKLRYCGAHSLCVSWCVTRKP
jgi:hypothetical protein